MESFFQNFCQCEAEDKPKHILEKHLEDILIDTLQPVFKKHSQLHPTLSRKPKTKYRTEDELHDNQLWKESNHVDILFWILENIDADTLENHLSLLIPPVLIVLDDYDIGYKTKGAKMVHSLIQKLDPAYISQYGLDNVFIESLFHCLLILSDADRSVSLLEAIYPCLLDLIATKREEQTRILLYERVLKEGVMRGFFFAGDKIDLLPTFLRSTTILFGEVGALGVQYLNALIPRLCNGLTPGSGKIREVNKLSIIALKMVIRKCWPRIPSYKGEIMKAIAQCWMSYYPQKDEEMADLLKELYDIFEAALQGQETADKEALLAFKRDIFEPLFS